MHGTITKRRKLIKPKRRRIVVNDEETALLLADLACAEARESLWAFRLYMHPELEIGWFVRHATEQFQVFYEDFTKGLRPRRVFTAPPQHGKSSLVVDFLAWAAGKNPDIKFIFTSYAEKLGKRANMLLQRMFTSPKYHAVFPETCISDQNVVTLSGRWLRNSENIEFMDRLGSFYNTTVNGQITGAALDIGVIDDPIKGRKEASSPTIRESTWNWLADDFFTRFSKIAGFLMIMTRWHVDDPVARFIEKFPETQIMEYPALAKRNDRYRDKGEPLFPELKPLDFLMERRRLMATSSFSSIYQCSPYVVGGSMFSIEEFNVVRAFDKRQIKASVRYWDKAGTDKEDGAVAFTAGVLMHWMEDGSFLIEDVQRVQKASAKREKFIKQTAEVDRKSYDNRVHIWVEQEPGSGGKESAERSIQNLAGFPVYPDKVSGDKVIRAEPYQAQVEAGNVSLLAAEWNRAFLDEHEVAPDGVTKDQWDASAGAFNKLTLGSEYDTSMGWVTGGVAG